MQPSDFINPSCGICGGEQIYIRGRYPKDDRRLVCSTCLQERMEQINSISSREYGVANQA